MTNYLTTDTELISIANAIRNKGGTTATLTYPTEYITAINNISTGGDGSIYAAIKVNYPAGSICSITNGIITLTAENTSGEVVFGILTPNSIPEAWIITSTDGVDTASDTVNVTTYGQVISYTIGYADNTLENNTWATISRIARTGMGDRYWDVGDKKAITLNGKIGMTNYNNYATYVFILDFNHPIGKNTSDNNIIFGGFKNASNKAIALCDVNYDKGVYNGTKYFNMNHKGNSSYGGYFACDMRYDILGATETQPDHYNNSKTSTSTGYDGTQTAINNPLGDTLMAAIPSDFRSVLRLYNHYLYHPSFNAIRQITDAGISLLTEYEIHGTRTYANTNEQNYQTQMTYFKNGGSKVYYKSTDTSAGCFWFVASDNPSNTSYFCAVANAGQAYNVGNACYSLGIVPTFKV